ncbi:MAG: hypothetical protein LBV23_12170 [Deltaproteobacteria bacterium]|jgi:ADP-ribose pyrophosphatase YjhB (NUDIX family)|nr:hypothetical protein [Deltaproteobacteria bacterium]
MSIFKKGFIGSPISAGLDNHSSQDLGQIEPPSTALGPWPETNASVALTIWALVSEEVGQKNKKPDAPCLKLFLSRGETQMGPSGWGLPLERVFGGESLDEAAHRAARVTTGIEPNYIEQLSAYRPLGEGKEKIEVRCHYLVLVDLNRKSIEGLENEYGVWFSFGFEQGESKIELSGPEVKLVLPLIKQTVSQGRLKENRWKAADNADLPLDCCPAVVESLLRLQKAAEEEDLIFNLAPERFTLSFLQSSLELILDRKLLAPAFRRKIAPKLKPTDRFLGLKQFRPSRLFEYNPLWRFKENE